MQVNARLGDECEGQAAQPHNFMKFMSFRPTAHDWYVLAAIKKIAFKAKSALCDAYQ
ncbi:hypothetical protein [Polaromonas sp. CG9_12]|nr:hypothetical protein [Polaromonas sp. CG9_12]